ncbi:phage tailspike protein [Burkholderia vietnamiensis]|uniref:phage tailspike protein n=1 Tax=Burkholderia vietnamiensis TaxID=60552 RepID=UPI00352C26DE
MLNLLANPLPFIAGLDGKPLDGGQVYIGLPNTNPVTNQVTVYQDPALTIPFQQPMKTTSGYVSIGGQPVPVFSTAQAYSMAVLDKRGRVVWSQPNVINPIGQFGGQQLGFQLNAAGSVLTTIYNLFNDECTAAMFGAVGDGVTDDTVALQAFFDYARTKNRRGRLKGVTYAISGTLNIPVSQNWQVWGEPGTTILQTTDNVPIINFGSDNGSAAAFNVVLQDITFNYKNAQPVANTAANCIFFNTMWFHVTMQRLTFLGGYYGIGLKSGIGCPWGCYWNELVFGSTGSPLSGGAINWNGGVNAVPNNVWGRFTVNAGGMAGPIFNQLKGYNWTIDAIEILSANSGPQLMNTQAGSVCTIGAIKLEIGSYTATQTLYNFQSGSSIRIGQLNLGGTTMVLNPATGSISIFGSSGGGSNGSLEIGTMVLGASTLGSNVYILGSTPGQTKIGHLITDANAWQLQNFSGTVTSNLLAVSDWKNDQMSTTDNGDADYTATLGDPNILRFETALTAPRTINLDSVGNNLFDGMFREFRIKGAINGTNTITVKCAGATVATLTQDCVIRFTFARVDPSHVYNCWKVTKYSTGMPA